MVYREVPDVRELVRIGAHASGFHHYLETGFQDRSPNCLFDESFYRKRYPGLFQPGGLIERRGYRNGYDHYLDQGAAESRFPSHYFDEAVWTLSCETEKADRSLSSLEQFLIGQRARASTAAPNLLVFRRRLVCWPLSRGHGSNKRRAVVVGSGALQRQRHAPCCMTPIPISARRTTSRPIPT